MRTPGIALACLGVAASIMVWQVSAHANCAMPQDYNVIAEGNTVRICPANHEGRSCPDESGMLRENAESHDVVKLADFCQGKGYSGPCYVDECVPRGTWYYGFAEPYECCPGCCGTEYYSAVEVTQELAESCERSEGNDGPVAFAGAKPWKDDSTICGYENHDAGPDASVAETGTEEDVDAEGDGPTDPSAKGDAAAADDHAADDDGGGCSISAGPRGAVLAINALVFALGLGLLGRRRTKG